MSVRVLVISYFVNEDTMACSHHVDDRISELSRQTDVCCLLSSCCVPRWPGMAHSRRCALSPSGIRFELRFRFRRLVRRKKAWKIFRDLLLLPVLPFYGIERAVRRLDPTWYWYSPAVRTGLHLCRKYRINALYSTGGPPVAHQVAATLKQQCNVRWIAEVQDPLIHGYCASHDEELKRLLRIERQTYSRSDAMVFLTRNARQETGKRLSMGERELSFIRGVLRPVIKRNMI